MVSKRNHPEQQKEALLYYRDIILCGRQNIALRGHHNSDIDNEVYKQQAQTMATLVLYSTFVSRLEILS